MLGYVRIFEVWRAQFWHSFRGDQGGVGTPDAEWK